MGYYNQTVEVEDKAGYNQAGEISKLLSVLRSTFTGAMIEKPNNFFQALEACRATLNIIAGKVPEEDIEVIDTKIVEIETQLYRAEETYTDENNGNLYFKFPQYRIQLKRKLEKLWRTIERKQDEYGYGMFAQDDDSGL